MQQIFNAKISYEYIAQDKDAKDEKPCSKIEWAEEEKGVSVTIE